jgi:hypothetical protein
MIFGGGLLSRLQAGKQPAAGSQPAPHGVVNISDLRDLAKRRVPRAVFDYVDGGAEGEVTLRENIRAFEEVVFQPRHAV